ncbi:mitochondrial ATP synthase epsilon subunit [Elysia marginata]|uniref:Mitochondrial ATP synthase epsilon subunit n=1 Tax=Elysia marginata TaxID=1093978 RepID=A0AAV4FWF8_9GAST|nr:mitochondrial ATP synthase epsilon subunit [Elysia marginata]
MRSSVETGFGLAPCLVPSSSVRTFTDRPSARPVTINNKKVGKITNFLNYVNYSSICAKVLRQALKEPFKAAAANRDQSIMKTSTWENGKIVKTVGGAQVQQ